MICSYPDLWKEGVLGVGGREQESLLSQAFQASWGVNAISVSYTQEYPSEHALNV